MRLNDVSGMNGRRSRLALVALGVALCGVLNAAAAVRVVIAENFTNTG